MEIQAAGRQGAPHNNGRFIGREKSQEDGCLCLSKKQKQTGYRTYIDFLGKEVELSRVEVAGISCPETFYSVGLGRGPAVREVRVFCG